MKVRIACRACRKEVPQEEADEHEHGPHAWDIRIIEIDKVERGTLMDLLVGGDPAEEPI